MNTVEELIPSVSAKDHSQGSTNAAVTLVEFGDFECPACGEVYPILKSLQQKYKSKLRVVFRHFPLSQIHKHAHNAAKAAEAAAHFGLFWQMHDRLFENQEFLDEEDLRRHARAIGIEEGAFMAQYEGPYPLERIRDNVASGNSSGVSGTPSFFVNGVMYRGQYDTHSLTLAFEGAEVNLDIPMH